MFLIPAALTVLITIHLAMIMRQHHSQFPGVGDANATWSARRCGPPMRCVRSGCCSPSAAVLFLLGGLIQINPIWQWGPYHVYLSENGAQPDWYIGWLIGALRLMPNFEPRSPATRSSPTRSGAEPSFPLSCSESSSPGRGSSARSPRDQRRHDLLDRPRDRPTRTAIGAAFLSWVVIIFAVGSTDRLFYRLHISYTGQIHFWRAGVWVVPVIVFVVTRSGAGALQRSGAHPLRAGRARSSAAARRQRHDGRHQRGSSGGADHRAPGGYGSWHRPSTDPSAARYDVPRRSAGLSWARSERLRNRRRLRRISISKRRAARARSDRRLHRTRSAVSAWSARSRGRLR